MLNARRVKDPRPVDVDSSSNSSTSSSSSSSSEKVEATTASVKKIPSQEKFPLNLTYDYEGRNEATMSFDEKPTGGKKFSEVFLEKHEENTASVNAGDYKLYVGGQQINETFLDLISDALHDSGDKIKYEYQSMHRQILNASIKKTWTGQRVPDLVWASEEIKNAKETFSKIGLIESLGMAGCPDKRDMAGFSGSIGSIFLDVFEKSCCPKQNDQNVAMLYVVGPRGKGSRRNDDKIPSEDKLQFLKGVKEVAELSLNVISVYNYRAKTSEQLPEIKEVRWCLVSGGSYRHPNATKVEVAKATIYGMMDAERCEGVNVKMMYDENAFKKAYDEIVQELQINEAEQQDATKEEDIVMIATVANECKTRPPDDKSGIEMFPKKESVSQTNWKPQQLHFDTTEDQNSHQTRDGTPKQGGPKLIGGIQKRKHRGVKSPKTLCEECGSGYSRSNHLLNEGQQVCYICKPESSNTNQRDTLRPSSANDESKNEDN